LYFDYQNRVRDGNSIIEVYVETLKKRKQGEGFIHPKIELLQSSNKKSGEKQPALTYQTKNSP